MRRGVEGRVTDPALPQTKHTDAANMRSSKDPEYGRTNTARGGQYPRAFISIIRGMRRGFAL